MRRRRIKTMSSPTNMTIKAIVTINLGLYMDIRPEIDIEVPDGLQGRELVEWLHTEYKDLLKNKENHVPCAVCGGILRYGGTGLSKEGLCGACTAKMQSDRRDFKVEKQKHKTNVRT